VFVTNVRINIFLDDLFPSLNKVCDSKLSNTQFPSFFPNYTTLCNLGKRLGKDLETVMQVQSVMKKCSLEKSTCHGMGVNLSWIGCQSVVN